MNATTSTRRAASSAALVLVALLAGAPLAAAGTTAPTHPTKAQVEHAEHTAPTHPTKAQVEQAERTAAGQHRTKAQVEHAEETGRTSTTLTVNGPAIGRSPSTGTPTTLELAGAAIALGTAGAVGLFAVRRRHQAGPRAGLA